MKKMCVVVFLMISATTLWGQKVKIKDGIAYVDGVEYIKWDYRFAGNEISVVELENENEVLFISYLDYSDPMKVSNSNPKGLVRWEELKFLSLGISCEVQSMGQKGLVKLLYENEVFQQGKLNEDNARKLVRKYGTRFSDQRPTTIIISH